VKPVDTRHPDDERLVVRYFDAASHDQELELHLVRCGDCAARAGRLAALLDADHDRTLGRADAWFGTERLARQRGAILERLTRRDDGAVVAFPGQRAHAPVASRVIRSRWAAAAVLVVSVGLGSGSWFNGAVPASQDRYADGGLQASLAPLHEGEEALLLEIDRALDRPQTRELRALEALTPRADEAVEF